MTTFERIRSGSHASIATDVSATSRPQRVSMEDYYHNQLTRRLSAGSDTFENPPSYDVAVAGLHLPPSRFKVQPREDEGCEKLPEYTCSIAISAVFARKMEVECAVHKAHDRNWYKVHVELQGTALNIFKTKSAGVFSKEKTAANLTPDQPTYLRPGEFIRSYNLQHGDAGIAADYVKRRYVIRLRVETEQFLLSCIEIETFLLWLESLSAAINLAPPLDERKIPTDNTMPRIRRRRLLPGMSEIETNENLIRQQQQIMRTQYPRLADETIPEDEPTPAVRESSRLGLTLSRRSSPPSSRRPSMSRRSSTTASNQPESMATMGLPSRPQSPERTARVAVSQPRSGPSRTTQGMFQARTSTSSYPNPSVSPETGKWKPVHQWSPMYDMMYAKRCMAVLLSKSPHKTNLVIMRGKQWMIDWATGALSRVEPPGYLEMDLVGPWGLSPGGLIVRT